MLKPTTRMEKSGETQDTFAGRLPNDMTNHLIWKGGKDQESLSGLIPFRAKFECLGLRSPWERASLSQCYLHLGSSLLACGQVVLCIGGCLARSLVSTHQWTVTQTNPPPPPVWTKESPDIVNITPAPSRA